MALRSLDNHPACYAGEACFRACSGGGPGGEIERCGLRSCIPSADFFIFVLGLLSENYSGYGMIGDAMLWEMA